MQAFAWNRFPSKVAHQLKEEPSGTRDLGFFGQKNPKLKKKLPETLRESICIGIPRRFSIKLVSLFFLFPTFVFLPKSKHLHNRFTYVAPEKKTEVGEKNHYVRETGNRFLIA